MRLDYIYICIVVDIVAFARLRLNSAQLSLLTGRMSSIFRSVESTLQMFCSCFLRVSYLRPKPRQTALNLSYFFFQQIPLLLCFNIADLLESIPEPSHVIACIHIRYDVCVYIYMHVIINICLDIVTLIYSFTYSLECLTLLMYLQTLQIPRIYAEAWATQQDTRFQASVTGGMAPMLDNIGELNKHHFFL